MKLVRAKEGYRKVGDKYLLAKKCTKCGKWLVASTDNFYREKGYKYGLRADCKECKKGYDKQWQKANRDRKIENNKQYYEANIDSILEQQKQYHQSPQGQIVSFNAGQRRRAKKEQQGTGITKDQWLECMNFFDWKCAYSGEKLKKDTRTLDHIVPLNSGGDHEIWNLVPMTRSLNSSKQAKNMLEWYKEQDCFSEARLAKIYEWQEYARKKWKIS